jgi:GNAT superfamily N-acetyltransferase
MTGNVRIVKAGAEDSAAVAGVIAAAFHDLPQSRWLVSDSDARREIFGDYFGIWAEYGTADGGEVFTATVDGAVVGGSIWLRTDPGEEFHGPPDYDKRMAAVAGQWIDRFRAFDATLEQNHPGPPAPPHMHLAMIAVRADHQGRGVGGAMLAAYHRQQSEAPAPLPTYLEAAEERSARLYERHGYRLMTAGPFHLPDDGPPMWPMWRWPDPA